MVDCAVAAWLEREGIDPKKVLSYSIAKSSRESVIQLNMFFEDIPEEVDPDGVSAESDV